MFRISIYTLISGTIDLRDQSYPEDMADNAVVSARASYAPYAQTSHCVYGYSVSEDRCWIRCGRMNILRLPLEQQAACSEVYESTVVIGCENGRVPSMKLHENIQDFVSYDESSQGSDDDGVYDSDT